MAKPYRITIFMGYLNSERIILLNNFSNILFTGINKYVNILDSAVGSIHHSCLARCAQHWPGVHTLALCAWTTLARSGWTTLARCAWTTLARCAWTTLAPCEQQWRYIYKKHQIYMLYFLCALVEKFNCCLHKN